MPGFKKLSLLYSLVLFLQALKPSAQESYTFQQLDNSNGLSNSAINYIFQDHDDLLWLGTWDGLNMYDGSTFHVFNYRKGNDATSVGSNIIYQIEEDKHRNVWIATIDGVSKYNKNSGKFSHYFYNTPKKKKLLGKGFSVAIDINGIVYCASKSESFILLYDEEKDNFLPCQASNDNGSNIEKMLFDKEGRLWVLKEDGTLNLLQIKRNKLVPVGYKSQVTNVADIFYVNEQVFYTTIDKRLIRTNKQLHTLEEHLVPKAIRSMAYYQDHYFLAWSSIGIGEYTRDFRPASDVIKQEDAINNRRITYLNSGNEDILWAGTDGNGIITISENNNPFGLVKKLPNGTPINIPVRAFCEVDGELWVGTKGNGIINIKNLGKPNATSKVIKNFFSGTDLLDNCVYAIKKDNERVYIGADVLGVTVYDIKSKKFIYWNQIIGNEKYPPFRSVHTILPDGDSSLWLGTENFGLVHLKLSERPDGLLCIDYLERYNTLNETGPGNEIIYSLASGGLNELWVGCRYGGLSLFNKETKKFKTYKAFSDDKGLSNNDVLSLYRDEKERLWIGTSYGLNWLDALELKKDHPAFGHLNTDNGLPNNTVHGITEDSRGDIWISTNKGLVRINPATLKSVTFAKLDELQSNEFSDGAVWKNNEGYLFFGGIYGFNYFMPENIQMDTEQPKLLLSNIKLAGKLLNNGLQVLNAIAPNTLNYALNRNDNYFELNIVPVKFSNQEKWSYTYLLEGNDKSWNNPGDDKRISYSNIPPGTYTLKIKWSNSEGIWSDEMDVMEIEVKQYVWLTYPAFILYIGILFIVGYLWYRYRRNKLVMEHNLSMEHLLRSKDEEVHQEQLNFFTNIAHELQSPLTLISGALERYLFKNKQEEKQLFHHKFLSIVSQQTSRLHYLIYQLLEFRKAEAGYLNNNYSKVNLSALLYNIAELFMPLSDQRELDFDYQIEPNIIIWTDKDKLEKIIFNLLSNAFKHTGDDQRIIVSLSVNSVNNVVKINVANSGFELTQQEMDKLFGKFIVLDNTPQNKISSGVGLAFCRELAALLQGNISVSNKDRWISFIVELPLDFIPPEEKIVTCSEKPDSPSQMLQSMTANLVDTESHKTEDNNKEALMVSMENEHKRSILIVEDDPSIRFLLHDILKDLYIIYEASNGTEALQLMRRIIPNLIISDVMMPDMNGLEVCRIVKETPATCHIPFIILSARGTIENKTEGYEVGADAYIPKPFQIQHLLVRIKKLIEYQQKLHELFKQDKVLEHLLETGMKEDDRLFLKNTISLIHANLDNPELDSSLLEKELLLSRANFFRKLKALSGMTPGELIKSIRLQQVAHLLMTSDLTITEIFYKTGFNNQSHFFREFKKKYGCSPNEYREKHFLPS